MSKTTMTMEEQLEDLQRRFQLLEGERKATFETAQLNIKQNKEIIRQLKEENKSLRTQIGQLRIEAPQSAEKQLDEKVNDLSKLKNKVDSIKDENDKKTIKLEQLTQTFKQLEGIMKSPAGEYSSDSRQIRVLENRIDKSMIKLNEAQSIKRTYEKILKRLQDERIGFDNQLASIEKTLKAKEHDYEELLLLSHDAYHAKEMAQAELHRFEQGVMEERNQRDKEVQEKKALVQQRVEMNHRLEQRERMLKQQQELEKAGELALSTTSAMGELASGMTFNEAEAERQKFLDFEEAFKRLKEATGVVDVNEVIQKFLTQEDTQSNLVNLTQEYQGKIDSQMIEVGRLKTQLDELKFSASGNVGKRQVVEDFESHLAEANMKCERNKQKYEKLAKILIDINAGVSHLAQKLSEIKLDGESLLELSNETVEEVLSQCELKLSKLMAITHMDSQVPGAARKPKIDTTVYDEKIFQNAQSDIRIKSTEQDADIDDDDDEFDDEIDDDVWNRKHVKYNSEQILEKQQKKKIKAAAAAVIAAAAQAGNSANNSKATSSNKRK